MPAAVLKRNPAQSSDAPGAGDGPTTRGASKNILMPSHPGLAKVPGALGWPSKLTWESMLTLVEEFILLTLRDEGGAFIAIPSDVLEAGIVGATLMELSLQGRIDSDLRLLVVANRNKTGQDFLDLVLEHLMRPSTDRRIRLIIPQLVALSPTLRDMALASLCRRGVLKTADSKYLWLFNERRYPIRDGRDVTEAKLRLLSILISREIPTPRDLCLISLATTTGILQKLVGKSEWDTIQTRVSELAGLDIIGASVQEHIRSVREQRERAFLRGEES
jgi:Golgi phosphoprotein 3